MWVAGSWWALGELVCLSVAMDEDIPDDLWVGSPKRKVEREPGFGGSAPQAVAEETENLIKRIASRVPGLVDQVVGDDGVGVGRNVV